MAPWGGRMVGLCSTTLQASLPPPQFPENIPEGWVSPREEEGVGSGKGPVVSRSESSAW